MESFSKKYKIIPFMLIFMTPLVSILYNVLKLVPEIKKMTAPYAPVFSLLFNLLWVIFTISLIKMMIQVWKNVHDSYQLVLAQKARDMLLVQEKEVEQFQKNIVKRQEEVYKTLEKALTDSRAGDYATLEKRVSQLTEHLQTNHSETFCSNSLLNTILQIKKEKAEQAAEQLVKLGIRAIWNFAHLDLELPDDVVVENVHLSDSLMQLSYNIVRRQDNE